MLSGRHKLEVNLCTHMPLWDTMSQRGFTGKNAGSENILLSDCGRLPCFAYTETDKARTNTTIGTIT